MSVWWSTYDATIDNTENEEPEWTMHWITMGGTVKVDSSSFTLSDGQYVMQYFSRQDIDSPGNF